MQGAGLPGRIGGILEQQGSKRERAVTVIAYECSFNNVIDQPHGGTPDNMTASSRMRRAASRPGISGRGARALPLGSQVAGKILLQQARSIGRRPFVEFAGEALSYHDANERATRVANAFVALGAKKGMRVAIAMRNCLEYLDLWFGLSKIGVVQVPLNTAFRSRQILDVLRRAPVHFIVSDGTLDTELAVALEQAAGAVTVLHLGASNLKDSARVKMFSFRECTARAESVEPDSGLVCGSDMGAIMNTSGTTGPSKGVQLSHAQQFILGRNIANDLGLTDEDVYYNFFPLFHNTAQAMITIPVLLTGSRMVLTEKFSASGFWTDVEKYRCTCFYYIGEILRILLNADSAREARVTSLRIGWGIGASPKDFVEFQKRYRVKLRSGYGSTEANVPCFLPRRRIKPGSVGRPLPEFEIRIADERGVPLPAGQTGEILVRSVEPYATMLGYDGDPQATLAAWRDLWFHTGDAGYADSDGDMFFVGRLRDVIRVRGENVSAFEIEETISQLPGVLEVAAIAVPCELGGDDIKIVIVPRPDTHIDMEAVIAHAAAQLPRHCVPRYIEIVEAMPKTETNKIQKHVLRATPFTGNTWDRQASRKPKS